MHFKNYIVYYIPQQLKTVPILFLSFSVLKYDGFFYLFFILQLLTVKKILEMLSPLLYYLTWVLILKVSSDGISFEYIGLLIWRKFESLYIHKDLSYNLVLIL